MTTLDTLRKALEALKSSTPTRRMGEDYVETGWEEHIAAMLALRAEIERLEAAEEHDQRRPGIARCARMAATPEGRRLLDAGRVSIGLEPIWEPAFAAAPPAAIPALKEDAERWRLFAKICEEQHMPPEARKHDAAGRAHFEAMGRGLGMAAAIDIALAAERAGVEIKEEGK